MSKEYYAIEFIGYGKKRVYVIKKVTENKLVLPVTNIGKFIFKTLESAQIHANNCRLTIDKVGDFYDII